MQRVFGIVHSYGQSKVFGFHQANETVEKELEQTQMRLSTASQELHSVKATTQQAQREREQVKDKREQVKDKREQVKDKREQENVFDVFIDNYRSLTTLLVLFCSGENTADE